MWSASVISLLSFSTNVQPAVLASSRHSRQILELAGCSASHFSLSLFARSDLQARPSYTAGHPPPRFEYRYADQSSHP